MAHNVFFIDRGTSFLSALLDNVFQLCAPIHKNTTAYYPQTNGIVEIFNRTRVDMPSVYVSSDHPNWDLVLPFGTFTYNS